MFRKMRFSVSPLCRFGPVALASFVLVGCSDREPLGLRDSAASVARTILPMNSVAVSLPVRGKCAADGTTGVAFNAFTGELHHVPVTNNIAAFSLPAGTYLFGWKKNLVANLESQVAENKLLYFPYEVGGAALPTHYAETLDCAAALLDPSLSNNADYWNVTTLNARLQTRDAASPSRSLITVTGTGPITLNPLTLNNTLSDANLRCEITDAGGTAIGLSTARNVYRLVPLSGQVLELAEERRKSMKAAGPPPGVDQKRWEWYLSLRFAFLDVEGLVQQNGTCNLQTSDGLGFLELVDGKKTYLSAGRSGQAHAARLTEAEAVYNSYYFYGAGGPPVVQVGRGGWTLDKNGLPSRDIQVMLKGVGVATFRVRIDENPEPGAKGYSTTEYRFICGQSSCAVQASGKPTFYAVWSGGEGTVVLKHRGGNNTTSACVSVAAGENVAPAVDEGCAGFRDFGNGIRMLREIGKPGGGTWNIGI